MPAPFLPRLVTGAASGNWEKTSCWRHPSPAGHWYPGGWPRGWGGDSQLDTNTCAQAFTESCDPLSICDLQRESAFVHLSRAGHVYRLSSHACPTPRPLKRGRVPRARSPGDSDLRILRDPLPRCQPWKSKLRMAGLGHSHWGAKKLFIVRFFTEIIFKDPLSLLGKAALVQRNGRHEHFTPTSTPEMAHRIPGRATCHIHHHPTRTGHPELSSRWCR